MPGGADTRLGMSTRELHFRRRYRIGQILTPMRLLRRARLLFRPRFTYAGQLFTAMRHSSPHMGIRHGTISPCCQYSIRPSPSLPREKLYDDTPRGQHKRCRPMLAADADAIRASTAAAVSRAMMPAYAYRTHVGPPRSSAAARAKWRLVSRRCRQPCRHNVCAIACHFTIHHYAPLTNEAQRDMPAWPAQASGLPRPNDRQGQDARRRLDAPS